MEVRQNNIILNAKKTLEEANAEVDAAKDKLNKFIETWQEKFSFLNDEATDHILLQAFFKKHDFELQDTMEKEAQEICCEELKKFYIKGDTFRKTVERRVRDMMVAKINVTMINYMEDINNSTDFKKRIGDKVTTNYAQLRDEWQELQADDNLIKEVPVEKFEEYKLSDDCINLTGKMTLQFGFKDFLEGFLLRLLRWVGYKDDKLKRKVEEFFEREDPIRSAYAYFKGERANSKEITAFFGKPRKHYEEQLAKQFEKMQKILDEAITAKRGIVKKSDEERRKVTDEAETHLREVILPYQRKISEFEDKVCRVYA